MIYLMIFILCVINLDTLYSYATFLIMGIAVAVLSARKKAVINDISISICVIGVLLMWVYGIVLGIFKGNALPFVIRNFAGIALYFSFFLFKFANVDCKKMIQVVFIASILVLCLVGVCIPIVFQLENDRYYGNLLNWLLGDAIIQNLKESTMIRIPTESALFPLISVSLYHVLYRKKKILYGFLFIASSIAVYLCDSGGFTLAYVALMAFFLFGILMRVKQKTRYCMIFAGICSFILLVTFFHFPDPFSYIIQIFSAQDAGNASRFNQISSIAKEITIFGEGLGAVFETINRTKEFPYAIEVIYLNIFHKFGALAMIYIGVLVYTYVRCLKNIYLNRNAYEAYICLGLMSFSIIALGNPVLFAPQHVIFHCIALYLLENSNDRKGKGLLATNDRKSHKYFFCMEKTKM